MRSKSCVLAFLLLLTGAVWAQGPSADSDRQDFERTAPPSWEGTPPDAAAAQDPAPSPPAVDDQDAEKMRQVNEVLAGNAAKPEVKAPKIADRAEPGWFMTLIRVTAALAFVLALAFGASYFAKRFGKTTALMAGTHLARVLGRVYLAPRVALHFVKTGDKVLVVGVSQNTIAPVAEFDAEAFEAALAKTEPVAAQASSEGEAGTKKGDFIAQLMTHLHQQREAKASAALEEEPAAPPEDPEIASLRNEIRSLRKFLDESTHETKP